MIGALHSYDFGLLIFETYFEGDDEILFIIHKYTVQLGGVLRHQTRGRKTGKNAIRF